MTCWLAFVSRPRVKARAGKEINENDIIEAAKHIERKYSHDVLEVMDSDELESLLITELLKRASEKPMRIEIEDIYV